MSLDHWLEPPDWGSPVEEDYEFRTEVITARDGSEQRIRQRWNPRLRLRWFSLARRGTLARVERRVAAGQGRLLTAPHPRLRARLQADVVASADQFDVVPPRPFWMGAGKQVLIVRPDGAWIIRDIVSVSGPTVTLTGTVGTAVPQESVLCPPVYCRFESSVEIAAPNNRVGSIDMPLTAVPGANPTLDRSFGAAATSYNGREVLSLVPNWVGSVTTSFEQAREEFDFGNGVTDYHLYRERTDRMVRLRFVVRDDDGSLDALLGCFYRAAGRQKAFYAPAWVESFTPILPLAAGPNLAVEGGAEHHDAYADQAMYRHVLIRTRSMGDLLRAVVGWSVDGGGNSVMVLDADLPAISAGEFVTARWLLCCRFASDALSILWRTRSVGECDVTLYALEDDE